MIKRIIKLIVFVAIIGYAFDKGYNEGYKDRDNKFPDDYT